MSTIPKAGFNHHISSQFNEDLQDVNTHLIDKVGRRRMAVLSDVGSALAVAALAVVDARVGPDDPRLEELAQQTVAWLLRQPTPDSSEWDDDHIAYQLVVGYEAEGTSSWAWLNRRIIALMQDALAGSAP